MAWAILFRTFGAFAFALRASADVNPIIGDFQCTWTAK
jgi:hypothetical protein